MRDSRSPHHLPPYPPPPPLPPCDSTHAVIVQDSDGVLKSEAYFLFCFISVVIACSKADYNSFYGTIPDTWAQLTSLTAMWVLRMLLGH